MNENTNTNHGFTAIVVAICTIFGGLQWLFLEQLHITGMFESWVIRAALMLSVVLTGVMIHFKFGRPNTIGQDVALWLGLGIEMIIMAFTFVTVVHPDVIIGTDIEQFAKFISGMNAITTVFVLIVYLALDVHAKNAHIVHNQRVGLVNTMYMQALNSPEIHGLVREQARTDVVNQLANDMRVPAYQLHNLLPSMNGKNGSNGNNSHHNDNMRTNYQTAPALPQIQKRSEWTLTIPECRTILREVATKNKQTYVEYFNSQIHAGVETQTAFKQTLDLMQTNGDYNTDPKN
jgi:hypothetical protein